MNCPQISQGVGIARRPHPRPGKTGFFKLAISTSRWGPKTPSESSDAFEKPPYPRGRLSSGRLPQPTLRCPPTVGQNERRKKNFLRGGKGKTPGISPCPRFLKGKKTKGEGPELKVTTKQVLPPSGPADLKVPFPKFPPGPGGYSRPIHKGARNLKGCRANQCPRFS